MVRALPKASVLTFRLTSPKASKFQCWAPHTKSSVKQEQNNYDLAPAERRPKHSKSNKMKTQKNMKYCGKNPQDRLNEEEIGNLPEKEFRVIIVKII